MAGDAALVVIAWVPAWALAVVLAWVYVYAV
jgi:hypothetical protein